jgi:FkbM family methyltransferase
VDALELMKWFVKKVGVYQLLEKWIIHTRVGASVFSSFMRPHARKKGVDLQIEKNGQYLNYYVVKQNRVVKIALKHFAYLQDIIDNFDYYFSAVRPDELNRQLVVDYSVSRQHILMPSEVPFFFSSFAEPLETTDIYINRGNLKEGDVVLDLGAYCGATVWSFAKVVGVNGRVYGFEPDPVNYEVLRKNVEYHKLSNVVTINKGVWSASGSLLFQGEGNMGSGISIVQSRAVNQYAIQVVTLNDFCAEYNITRIDYIKMDIEGAEVEVLKASGDVIGKYKPRLIIEPHVVGTHLVTDEVCEILSGYGYKTEILAQADLPLPLIYAYPLETE